MKTILIALLFLLLNTQQSKIHDFRLKGLDNADHTFSQLQGKEYTIIDFWASWCKPCLKAIPKLNDTYDSYKNKGIEIIGINVDGPRNQAKVQPLTNALGIQYPVLIDPDGTIMKDLNILALPTLLIVDKNMAIVFTHEGYKKGDEQIIAQQLDQLLSEK